MAPGQKTPFEHIDLGKCTVTLRPTVFQTRYEDAADTEELIMPNKHGETPHRDADAGAPADTVDELMPTEEGDAADESEAQPS